MTTAFGIFLWTIAAVLFYVAYLSTIAPWETRLMEVMWFALPLLGGIVLGGLGAFVMF